MKYNAVYQETIGCPTAEAVFHYLTNNLVESITYWDYFVAWNTAHKNIRPLEIELNTINYLVGKPNIEAEFRRLLVHQPSVARIIPILLASREKNFTLLTDFSNQEFKLEKFSFEVKDTLNKYEIDKICRFARETGLLDLFETGKLKSIPDYVLGVEVGLGSNGRKNRSGAQMEIILDKLTAEICRNNGLAYLRQVNPKRIQKDWGITLTLNKASRNFDFAINTPEQLYLVETNYYGGGGSKLKATAGEYKQLYTDLTAQGHKFIWITDGLGWKTTQNPLEDAFNHIDHLLNLKMVTSGILEYILNHNL